MKKAIVIGGSSGIGKELALLLLGEGYAVGITARRLKLLQEIKERQDGLVFVKYMDISKPEEALARLNELIGDMGGLDLLVICAGTGHINQGLNWELESETIDVNVRGFTALAGAGTKHFLKQGSGHLVGISSIAALRGSGSSPSYNASKAYMSNYLEGIRCNCSKAGGKVSVTDIKPGFVDTDMAKGEGLFWVACAATAAKQIMSIIKHRKAVGYVTRRWRLIALLLKIMPGRLYSRMG